MTDNPAKRGLGHFLRHILPSIYFLPKLSPLVLSPSGHFISSVRGSTTIRLWTFRLRHFVYRHFVYRHFVYYCIPACRTVIHPTSVSENHYFHQFPLLFIYTMIPFYQSHFH